MRNLKIYILGIGAALALSGCGTTVNDALGDPPPRESVPVQKTAAPYAYFSYSNAGKVTIAGNKGHAEANAEITAFSGDGQVLGKDTATWQGMYRIYIDEGPEVVYLQAQSIAKIPSDLITVPLKSGF